MVDSELEALVLAGNVQALACLYEQYRGRLRQGVRLRMDPRLQGRIDLSDVLQDAFLDAARRLPEYVAAPDVSLFVWLRSLTLQRLVDLHRMHLGAKMRSVSMEAPPGLRHSPQASTQSLTRFLLDAAPTPGAKAIEAEMKRRIHDALETMDAIDRDVLAMRHFEMMTNNEVAHVLGLSKAAASNRYVRALERLHDILNGDLDA